MKNKKSKNVKNQETKTLIVYKFEIVVLPSFIDNCLFHLLISLNKPTPVTIPLAKVCLKGLDELPFVF